MIPGYDEKKMQFGNNRTIFPKRTDTDAEETTAFPAFKIKKPVDLGTG